MDIEQGNKAPELRIARAIGRTAATFAFGLEQGIQNIGGTIFKRLNVLNPLATDTFTISDTFDKLTTEVLTAAVKKSNLPEGIHIANPRDPKPNKPFVVITFKQTTREARKVFERGAKRYEAMDLDIDRLAQKLSTPKE